MQGWIIRRCLTFTKNRLANRPHKPRDPIILKYLADIGICWPDDAEEEEEEQEEQEDTVAETDHDDDDDDDDEDYENELEENEESEQEPDPIVEVDGPVGGGVTSSPNDDQKEGATHEMPCPTSPSPLSCPVVVSPKPLTPELVTPEPRTKSMSTWTPPNVEVPQLAVCSCRFKMLNL